ncbi:ATP-binding protein [Beggiatoa leptomitoformis]|uniref:AAA family ATPase n=1 Tax=Beggiatoa leptomitoformis TaxID=288004 RepID=A0A2N9YCS1_9GAMM|nr:ATP-binding protein [Beggiatoa leptomitoformis]AUI68262.1 AAA family ATPase [Beggiatoa leptomitoformis]QGX03429.1 AAA family ATPase [Beggiatoa leptomitoformis]
MKLVQVRLRNFRSYKEEVTIDIEKKITALLGCNDAGKSTVLDALDIFFNDVPLDKHDACKTGDAQDVAIICVFDELPESIVLDEEASTTLQVEYLLNLNKQLEIHKTFDASLEKPKSKFELKAFHPTHENAKDLITLTNDKLKKRAREAGVSADDERCNSSLRRAIRDQIGETQLQLDEQLISLADGNAKKIWGNIQSKLPLFALFKSDRPSNDQDAEAQDPLTIAIKEALKTKTNELDAISEFVKDEVSKVTQRTLDKLCELDDNLATTLKPQFSDFKLDKWASVFKTSIIGDNDIPINKRGSGVRRLILLSFFRAKAELSEGENSVIYAIEEPETSQHPNYQRLLFEALSELSSMNQILITTHTPVLARLLDTTAMRFIHQDQESGKKCINKGGTDEINHKIVRTLGILPEHNVKLFIMVEGRTDIDFLKQMSFVLRREHEEKIPDLQSLDDSGQIVFIPIGGFRSMDLWICRLEGFSRPEFHLYDKDEKKPDIYLKCVEEINKRPNCSAQFTEKKEIECYIHSQAINKALSAKAVNVSFSQQEITNCNEKINCFIAGRINKEGWKKNLVKIFLCKEATNNMTVDLLKEIDAYDEVIKWFQTMNTLITSNK